MSNTRKEWLLKGSCKMPNGGEVYFYGKTTASSDNQAFLNICWDIKRSFNIESWVTPVLDTCTTLTSKDFLLRRLSPNSIKYFRDKNRKVEIEVEKRTTQCASSIYGEEGEEIFDLF